MSSADIASVNKHFDTQGLNASSEWIAACVEWCRQETPSARGQALVEACVQQWKDTDIRSDGVQKPRSSPEVDYTQPKSVVAIGAPPLALQVVAAVDISQSAYSQLQKVRNVKDENSRVSADDDTQRPFTANWQPKANRTLLLTMTDGARTFRGIEHQFISQIPTPVPAGLKLLLRGSLVCRRGLLMLTPAHVQILGGVVEEMLPECSSERLLSAALQGDGEESGRGQITFPSQRYVQPQSEPVVVRHARPSAPARSRPLRAVQYPVTTSAAADVFNDDDDELFSQIDLSAVASGSSAFSVSFDDADEFLSQVEMPGETPGRSAPKRMRF
jgi:RecQ-mediated genome instability protein 1